MEEGSGNGSVRRQTLLLRDLGASDDDVVYENPSLGSVSPRMGTPFSMDAPRGGAVTQGLALGLEGVAEEQHHEEEGRGG